MDALFVLSYADLLFSRLGAPLTTLVLAMVTLLLGFILGRILDRLLLRLFVATGFDDLLAKGLGHRRSYSRATRVGIVRFVYLLTILLVLNQLNILGIAVLVALSIVLFIGVISLLLSVRDFFSNAIGQSLLQKRGVVIGTQLDVLTQAGMIRGKVVRMTVSDTYLAQKEGEVVAVPNMVFRTQKFSKRSKS